MELDTSIIACPDCGQLHRYRMLGKRQQACCIRCGSHLYRHRPNMIQKHLALCLSCLILLVMTYFFPLIALKVQGMVQELTLLRAVEAFWSEGWYSLALLSGLNIIVLPLLELAVLFWVFFTLQWHWSVRPAIVLFRWLTAIKPWVMLEVFMLGALVAMVKLGDMAEVVIGTAFWSFAALIIVMAMNNSLLDSTTIWRELGKLQNEQA